VGTGVNLEKIFLRNFTQGALTTTGMGTDLAVSGNGYFVVKNPATARPFATALGTSVLTTLATW